MQYFTKLNWPISILIEIQSKALDKRGRKQTQVANMGLLATPFGQGLRALALTCDDLR